jgi:hypothetical protein
VTFYFIYRILKAVKDPAVETPERIKGWLKILLAAAVAFLALDLVIALWKGGWAWSKDAEAVLRGGKSEILWPVCWLAYFNRSARVKAFYSGPAAPPPPPAPAPGAAVSAAPIEPG